MRSILFSTLAAAAGLALSGCSNLKDKAVAFGGGGQVLRIETTGNPQNGSMPMPNVVAGDMDMYWVDIPKDAQEYMLFQQSKSIWSKEPAFTAFVWYQSSQSGRTLPAVPSGMIPLPQLKTDSPRQSP